MKRFIKYNSIIDFAGTIKNVTHAAKYVGYDEEKKEAIYDNSLSLPKLMITGSEKIHGTNAAFCFSSIDGPWVQSRKNIITKVKDNASCATTIYGTDNNPGTLNSWIDMVIQLAYDHKIDLGKYIISIFFEWAGGNIQKNSACSGMEKKAIIFQHFKVSPIEPIIGTDGEEESSYWLETSYTKNGEKKWIDNPNNDIYNIMNYDTWRFEVDFNNPKLVQNDLIDLVINVIEPASPFGKNMGKDDNVGEGAVFTFIYQDVLYKFKVKGDKHSASKVKTLKPVDNEREQAKIDIATKVTPAWRLEQMYAETFDTINGGKGDKRRTGDFIRAVVTDIQKEEIDNILDAGFESKEIFPFVSKIAKTWFFEQLNKEVGL